MTLAASLLPEFDQEFAGLRRAIAAVPEERLDWQPHERAFTLRGLVTHLAGVTRWGLMTLEQDEVDIDPAGDHNTPVPSVAAALATFDAELAALRAALAAADDEHLRATWTFKLNGRVHFARPRWDVLRSFVISHMIHHRGQLSLALRVAGLPVPSLYGPTADDQP